MPVQPTYANSSTFGTKSSDLSVVLVTGSYDHEIRFWEAWSGICSRTIPRSGETGVRTFFFHASMYGFDLIIRT